MKPLDFSARFLCLILLISCSGAKTQEGSVTEWKEFDAFSLEIAKPFAHLKNPSMMDSVTLTATIQNINAIADSAEKLAGSALPDDMNNDSTKQKLEKIKINAKELAKQIAEGTEDDVIGTGIYNIYASFLEVKKARESKE
jgi:hypothetical protein